MEKWKQIKGYESLYEISNYGNVKSFHKNKDGKAMKLYTEKLNHTNYKGLTLVNKEGNKKQFRVHRLVAEHFIENKDNKRFVNHIDNNGENNNVDNLEWMTHADNVRYSICNKPSMKGDKNLNYGNRKLSKIYKENPKLALEKQSRKGIQNGRCVKIKLYYGDIFIKEFEYLKHKYIAE